MAMYDHGGGCPCGLQKVCDCKHADRYNKRDDIENLADNSLPKQSEPESVKLARIVAEKEGYVLIKKEEFQSLYEHFTDDLQIIKSQLESTWRSLRAMRKLGSKQ